MVDVSDADGSKLVYVVQSRYAHVYHPDSNCKMLRAATAPARRVPVRECAGRELCTYCDPDRSHCNWKNGECRSCGEYIGDGECSFCERFEAVHAVPKDAEVSTAPTPRLAADRGQIE